MRTVFRRRLKLRFFGLESGNEMRSSLPFASFFLFILFRVFDLAGDLRKGGDKERKNDDEGVSSSGALNRTGKTLFYEWDLATWECLIGPCLCCTCLFYVGG